jgi:hypothetical protein
MRRPVNKPDIFGEPQPDDARVLDGPMITPMETIAGLLADVKILINEEVVADLWAKYLRGEPVSFSRALYTLAGQRRFAELVQQYRVDDKFRANLETYTKRFEVVLRDLTTADADGMVTRSILGSAEGRIYTLLAHVSNRLG